MAAFTQLQRNLAKTMEYLVLVTPNSPDDRRPSVIGRRYGVHTAATPVKFPIEQFVVFGRACILKKRGLSALY